VFDREVAFLPPADGDPKGGAVLVREPAVVSHLLDSFDLLWQSGRVFPVVTGEDTDEALEELTQSILAQMAAGAKDEVIARRLGISVRTCRRYIADLTNDLGAQHEPRSTTMSKTIKRLLALTALSLAVVTAQGVSADLASGPAHSGTAVVADGHGGQHVHNGGGGIDGGGTDW